jgi:hypothetical protein
VTHGGEKWRCNHADDRSRSWAAVVDEAEVSPASTSSTICDQLLSQVSTLAAEWYVRLV